MRDRWEEGEIREEDLVQGEEAHRVIAVKIVDLARARIMNKLLIVIFSCFREVFYCIGDTCKPRKPCNSTDCLLSTKLQIAGCEPKNLLLLVKLSLYSFIYLFTKSARPGQTGCGAVEDEYNVDTIALTITGFISGVGIIHEVRTDLRTSVQLRKM